MQGYGKSTMYRRNLLYIEVSYYVQNSSYYSSYHFASLSLLLLLRSAIVINITSLSHNSNHSSNYSSNYSNNSSNNNSSNYSYFIALIYDRTTSKESLNRTNKRLDKISLALYGLRPRYIVYNLVARISLIFITIIISSYYNK